MGPRQGRFVFTLTNKKALITGGSRGIGRATALLFARAGADVALSYRTRSEDAAEVVAEIRRTGRSASALACDLADWDSAVTLPRLAAEALGGLDIVVNNAGVWLPTPVHTWSLETIDAVLKPNLYGVIAVSRGAADIMAAAGRGNIIHVASTAGQRGEANYGMYAASKGALIALTKSMAPELIPHGIRVNCVAPGWVETEMSHDALAEAGAATIAATIPAGRAAAPEEIASCILFLAADESSFVHGEILNANGGAVLCG
jgi:3-oxoacyl-[acyl-carrier protein] reductase